MEFLVVIIAMFIVVAFVSQLWNKGKNSSLTETVSNNLQKRIQANTADVVREFNINNKDSGMSTEDYTQAKSLLDEF